MTDKVQRISNWLPRPERLRWLVLLVALCTPLIAWPWAAWQFRPFDVVLSQSVGQYLWIDGHAGPPVLYGYRTGELRAWDWATGSDWQIPQPGVWHELTMAADISQQGILAFRCEGSVVRVTTLKPPFVWKEYHLPEHRLQWQLVMISSSGKYAVFLEQRDMDTSELVVVDLPAGAILDRLPLSSLTRLHSSVGEITGAPQPAFRMSRKRFRLDEDGRWQAAPQPSLANQDKLADSVKFRSKAHRAIGSKPWWTGANSSEYDDWMTDFAYKYYSGGLTIRSIESPVSHVAVFQGRHDVFVWSPDAETAPVHFTTSDRVAAASFTADGKHMVVFDDSSNLQVYDTATGQLVAEKSQAKALWWFCATIGTIGLAAAALSFTLACREQFVELAAYDAVMATILLVMTFICVDRETVVVAACGFSAAAGVLLSFVEGDAVSRAARGIGSVVAVTAMGLVPVTATFFIDGYTTTTGDGEIAQFLSYAFLATLSCLASAWLSVPVYRAAKNFFADRLDPNAASRKPIQFTIGGLMVFTAVVAALGAAPYWLLEQNSYGGTRLTTGGTIAIGAALAAAIVGNLLAMAWFRNWTAHSLKGFGIFAAVLTCGFILRGAGAFQRLSSYGALSELILRLALLLVAASIPLAVARYKGYRWN